MKDEFFLPTDFNLVKTENISNGNWHVYGSNTVDVSHLFNLQNNNFQIPSTSRPNQTSFEGHMVTSPNTFQRMDYECPCPELDCQSSPEYIAQCVDNSPVAIPTTVQEIEDGDQLHNSSEEIMPVNFVYLQGLTPILQNARHVIPPPGWTEGDVIEALTDQAIPLV